VDDRVIIDATATGEARVLEADLVARGMRRAVTFGRVVSGEVPIRAAPTLVTLDSLASARADLPWARSETPNRP